MLRTSEHSIKIPARHLCSITGEIMMDPVITADGHSYEREAIEQWLSTHDTSPKTGQKLEHKKLVPNWDKKSDIDEFLTENPALKSSIELYLPKAWIAGLVADLRANRQREVMAWFSKDMRLLTRSLEEGYTAFHLAAQCASPELTEAVWDQLKVQGVLKAIALSPHFKPIHLNVLLERALSQGDTVKADLWLGLGAELEPCDPQSGHSLLARRVIAGHLASVRWLLERGPSLSVCDPTGNSPLHWAVLKHQPTIAALLLSKGADPKLENNQGQSPLRMAVLSQEQALMAVFLPCEQAALPAYHIALVLGDKVLMGALLEQGTAAVDALDRSQRSPLWIASKQGDTVLVTALLDKGANLELACGEEQQTALAIAAKRGHLGVVQRLLKANAVLEATDVNGNTALHLAAETGQEAVLGCLLEAGAYHKAKNHQDQTPMELARAAGLPKVADYIEKRARALKQAKLEEIGILHQIVQEQSTSILQQSSRITQLEQRLAEQSKNHQATVQKQSKGIVALEKQSATHEKERLALEGQIASLEQRLKQRLTTLEATVTTLQPQVTTPLVFSFGATSSTTADSSNTSGRVLPFLPKPAARPAVHQVEVERFLRLVVEGEQDQAEALLKANPALALVPGTVTDLSKRTFENITGFQYAVWALDWHMWRMLRVYLPDEEAAAQLRSTGSWVPTHGVHAGMPGGPLDKLIKAYDGYAGSGYSAEHWQKQIGGAQLLLPAHVINEYCRPDRSFYPCPAFEELILPRTRKLSGDGEWFTAEYNGGKLGETFGIWRAYDGPSGPMGRRRNASAGMGSCDYGRADHAAVASLTKVRIQQRDQLASDLSSDQQHTARQRLGT